MVGAAAAAGMVIGTLAGFFLDPRSGRRRRHTVRDRTRSRLRRRERRAAVRARRVESRALGRLKRTLSVRRRSHERVDDVTLANKVETHLYRRARVPKGRISINAEQGVVFLRGTVDSAEEIARLGDAARSVDGVREIENLVHVHGTPAPTSRTKLEREGTVS